MFGAIQAGVDVDSKNRFGASYVNVDQAGSGLVPCNTKLRALFLSPIHLTLFNPLPFNSFIPCCVSPFLHFAFVPFASSSSNPHIHSTYFLSPKCGTHALFISPPSSPPSARP